MHSQTRASIISATAVITIAAAADLWLDDYRHFAKTSLGVGGRGGADEEKGRRSRSNQKLRRGEDEHKLRRHRLLLSVCEVNR